ncbi:MAG TPA: hypothetical protein VKY73_07355 [Polyangiaceae bacterium]|nr:hypothetical protein [Polyangiaceae bacterium]
MMHEPQPGTVGRPMILRFESFAIDAELVVPPRPFGTVLFAHGTGSTHRSARSRYVAERLRERAGVATLGLDLVSPAEAEADRLSYRLEFDIQILAQRLVAATDWVAGDDRLGQLPIGYFGATTGAAAALLAATARPQVRAVISGDGRPDLAGEALEEVRVPTLFIVGDDDPAGLELNRSARAHLRAKSELRTVPGVSRPSDEDGAVFEALAALTAQFFSRHLG